MEIHGCLFIKRISRIIHNPLTHNAAKRFSICKFRLSSNEFGCGAKKGFTTQFSSSCVSIHSLLLCSFVATRLGWGRLRQSTSENVYKCVEANEPSSFSPWTCTHIFVFVRRDLAPHASPEAGGLFSGVAAFLSPPSGSLSSARPKTSFKCLRLGIVSRFSGLLFALFMFLLFEPQKESSSAQHKNSSPGPRPRNFFFIVHLCFLVLTRHWNCVENGKSLLCLLLCEKRCSQGSTFIGGVVEWETRRSSIGLVMAKGARAKKHTQQC